MSIVMSNLEIIIALEKEKKNNRIAPLQNFWITYLNCNDMKRLANERQIMPPKILLNPIQS